MNLKKNRKKLLQEFIFPTLTTRNPSREMYFLSGPMSPKEKPLASKADTVIFKKWGGDEFKLGIGEKEYMFIKFEDILAIVK